MKVLVSFREVLNYLRAIKYNICIKCCKENCILLRFYYAYEHSLSEIYQVLDGSVVISRA